MKAWDLMSRYLSMLIVLGVGRDMIWYEEACELATRLQVNQDTTT